MKSSCSERNSYSFSAALNSVIGILPTFFFNQYMNFVTATPSLICAMRSFSTSTGFFVALGRSVRFSSSRIRVSAGILLTRRLLTFFLQRRTFFVLFKYFHILIDTVIGKKVTPSFFQRFQYVCLKGFLICKKSDLCFCHYKIRKNHRTTVDISPRIFNSQAISSREVSTNKSAPFFSIALRILAHLSALDSPAILYPAL